MTRLLLITIGSIVVALGPLAAPAPGQSLAELAKKEKERRSKLDTNTETRTVTARELTRWSAPGESSDASSSDESPADDSALSDDQDTAPEPQDETRTKAYWEGRLSTVNERIARFEEQLQRPEMTTDFRREPQRLAVEKQLNDARAEKQAILLEGRKQGVPPGWLR